MYTIPATSKTPALIIYLLDVSGSMSASFSSTTRIEAVTQALKRVAVTMVRRSTKGAIVAPRYRVAMIAYSSQTVDLLGGIKTIDEVAKIGVPQLTTMDMTDTAGAFAYAENLLKAELPNMQDCPAPLVCHMTDGEYNGADPAPIAKRIMNLSVPDGNVLIENIFVRDGIDVADPHTWPGINAETQLPDAYSQKLFEISSPIPSSYCSVMQEFGYRLDPSAKMFFPAGNAGVVDLGFVMSGATPVTANPG